MTPSSPRAPIPDIPVFLPIIDESVFAAAREALECGWLGMGSYVGAFERKLEKFIGGDRRVVAVSTGHAALHLALLLADVGPGDEVITPSFNNAADFQAIIATGARPVFCDIDDTSLCVDLDSAGRAIAPGKTKAIIVMDYDCVLCDHDRVADFARRHGLRVIHDAAHALGSRYNNRMVGSFSDIAIFSFDPVKTITCIDGGAVVVRSDEEVARLHAMRLLGMTQPATVMYANARAWTYDITVPGFRYHLANLHAAIGLAQLAKIDQIIDSRREACRHYSERLSLLSQVRVPATNFDEVAPFLYYIRVPSRHVTRCVTICVSAESTAGYIGSRGIGSVCSGIVGIPTSRSPSGSDTRSSHCLCTHSWIVRRSLVYARGSNRSSGSSGRSRARPQSAATEHLPAR